MRRKKRWVFVGTFLVITMAYMVSCCISMPAMTIAPLEIEIDRIDDLNKQLNLEERVMLSLLAVRRNPDGPVIGSGILVSIDNNPYMMTAYHVVDHMYDDGQTVKNSACHVGVYSRNENCVDILIGEEYNDITMLDQSMDAALVPLGEWPRGGHPVEESIESYQFRIGEEVLIIGCPTGIPDIVTRGIVTGFAGGDRTRPMTDAATWFGSSGGGVFLSTGEYVGYFHSMIGSRTPNGREMAEGLHIFSPLLGGWGIAN